MVSALLAEPVRVAAAVPNGRGAGPSNFGDASLVPRRTLAKPQTHIWDTSPDHRSRVGPG